jgi:hypothetical protein
MFIEQFKPYPLNNLVLVGNMGTIIRPNGKLAKQSFTNIGYLQCGIMVNNEVIVCKAHRIIALTWCDNPSNLPEVNHLDGIKTNNAWYNLQWSTHADNIQHSYDMLGRIAISPMLGKQHTQAAKDKMRTAKLGKRKNADSLARYEQWRLIRDRI